MKRFSCFASLLGLATLAIFVASGALNPERSAALTSPAAGAVSKPGAFSIVPPWESGKHSISCGYGCGAHQGTNSTSSTNDRHALDFDLGSGETVRAIASGTIVWADWYSGTSTWHCYGRSVAIAHDGNGASFTSFYAHLDSITVSVGSYVNAGGAVGTAGNTGSGLSGCSTFGAHLHFALYQNATNGSTHPPYGGNAVVPEPFSECQKNGSGSCENLVGGDSLTRSGSQQPVGPIGYTFCSRENERCSFSGTKDVAYGANDGWIILYGITGGIDCTNSAFGGDPIPGVVKACFSRDGSSPPCSYSADQVALFTGTEYGGQCVVKGIGDYPNAGAIGLPNDSIKSVKIGGSVQAVLCEHNDFGGTCDTFQGSDGDLGIGNGIGYGTSSVKVQQRQGCNNLASNEVALFTGTDYGGDCVVKGVGEYPNSGAIGLPNDSIKSVKIGGSVQAVLCEHNDFGGTCDTFQGSDGDLGIGNGIGYGTSSAKVQVRNTPSPPDTPTYTATWTSTPISPSPTNTPVTPSPTNTAVSPSPTRTNTPVSPTPTGTRTTTYTPTFTPTGTRTATHTPTSSVTGTITPTRTPTTTPTWTPSLGTKVVRTYRSSSGQHSIVDFGQVKDLIEISEAGAIKDLDVLIDLHHTYIGDLHVELMHETTGEYVVLLDRPLCSSNDILVTLDDEAAAAAASQCSGAPPALGGRYRPLASLTAFDGDNVSGAWSLRIGDQAAEDEGELISWSLTVSVNDAGSEDTRTPTPTRTVMPTWTRTSTPTPYTPGGPIDTPNATRTNTPPRPTPTPTPAPARGEGDGDANGDGHTDAVDAALILQLDAELILQLPAADSADVNRNGRINAIDAAIILQYAAGLLQELPL